MLASAGNTKFIEWIAYLAVIGEEVKAAQSSGQQSGTTQHMTFGG